MRAFGRLHHCLAMLLATTTAVGASLAASPAHGAATGGISGTVTATGSTALSGVSVRLYGLSGMGWSPTGMSVATASDGSYELAGLAAGRYRVCFEDGSATYLGECWNDKASVWQGEDILVAEGVTTSGKDAALARGGRISGVVTDAQGTPLPSVGVSVGLKTSQPGVWDFATQGVSTDDFGAYAVTGLRAGTYRVCFRDPGNTYVDECWNDMPTMDEAEDIVVSEGAHVTSTDAALDVEARIAGRVTDTSGAAVPNLTVTAWRKGGGPTGWTYAKASPTDATGRYEIGKLGAGTYRVCFEVGGSSFLSECWNDAGRIADAQDVDVTVGARVSGKDAVLTRGARIDGTITDKTGAAMAWTSVNVFQRSSAGTWTMTTSTQSDAHGRYAVASLRSGGYRLCFTNYQLYVTRCWKGGDTPEEADDIEVVSEGTVAIDMTMPTERYVNVEAPTVSGTPQVGTPLTVSPGVWTPSGATFEYLWEVGDGTLEGLAANTFTPRPEDLGKHVGVWVTAVGDAATGPSFYVHVGEVVAAATTTTPTPPSLPTLTPPSTLTPTPVPDVASQLAELADDLAVTGRPKVGRTVRVKGLLTQLRTAVGYTFQWYAGRARITKATTSRLKVTKAMRGKALKVKVSLSSGGSKEIVTIKVGRVR